MNRPRWSFRHVSIYVPRERGDEPDDQERDGAPYEMFPASAGMNRISSLRNHAPEHVPRERGDEPVGEGLGMPLSRCSPRARG